MADRVAGEDDLLLREEPLHTLVGHADLLGALGQQLVGDAGKGVLLLQQRGDAHIGCHIQRRAAGIASHPDGYVGTELLDDLAGDVLALQHLPQHRHILEQVLAVEPCYGQALDLVACSRHTLHFHAPLSADEQYGRFGLDGSYGIGDAQRREDVSACAAAADDYSYWMFHIIV